MRHKHLIKLLTAGGLLAFATTSSRAQVTMAINTDFGDAGNNYALSTGVSANWNGSSYIVNGANWEGIYAFTIQPGSNPSISNPFYTVCLSPPGALSAGNQTYNLDTFAQANPGINDAPGPLPSAGEWATGPSGQLWGVQNANYLFSTYSGAIMGGTSGLSGTTAEQGAALAMAMYAALFNSTGYGANSGIASGPFVNTSSDANVDTDYGMILNGLASYSGALATYGVLVPTGSTSQDFILLGSDLPQSFSTVPEPSTIIAGCLLLLPMGASTLRVIRRKKEGFSSISL